MTRDEWCALPLSTVLALLWEHSTGISSKMATVEAPRRMNAPKFDSAIYRKGGFMWASECDAESLRFWHDRYAKSAAEGGEYAEKDARRQKAIHYWLEWRKAEPHAVWSSERNHERVTASPPCAKPTIYEKQPRNDAPISPAMGRAPAFDDEDDIQY